MIDENRLIELLEDEILRIDTESKPGCGNLDGRDASVIEYTLNNLIDLINEQPKVNEWIPVTESLPEELQPVLVAYRGYHDKKIYSDDVAYIRCDDWVWNCDESDVIVEIVAWQPLPKPYKVKENVE